ncbi:Hypothetical_protein [Hexamita inflata]|uniref:Hypothetical_protein n=1 Tax=Hexamita inflata TaxID=28002 RepID=A0ABP1J0F3_9EUKA
MNKTKIFLSNSKIKPKNAFVQLPLQIQCLYFRIEPFESVSAIEIKSELIECRFENDSVGIILNELEAERLKMQIKSDNQQLRQIQMITEYLEEVAVKNQINMKYIRQTQIQLLDQIIEE